MLCPKNARFDLYAVVFVSRVEPHFILFDWCMNQSFVLSQVNVVCVQYEF